MNINKMHFFNAKSLHGTRLALKFADGASVELERLRAQATVAELRSEQT